LKKYCRKKYDRFANHKYSSSEWSAPTLTSYTKIANHLDSMHLDGRRIKDIRILGLCFGHREQDIEDYAYNHLPDNMAEDQKIAASNYDAISEEMKMLRFACIDEPLLIKFENGDVFEIEAPWAREYRFSMNHIPWDIKTSWYCSNVDAGILFSPVLGQTVVETELHVKRIIRNQFHEYEYAENVTEIILWLENGIGLSFSSLADYSYISCVDKRHNVLPITFRDLKSALHNSTY